MSPQVLYGHNSRRLQTEGHYFIDLFAGCGGLSLGLTSAGWMGTFAIEKSPDAFRTFSANLLEEHPYRPMPTPFVWPSWLPKEPMDISDLIRRHRRELLRLRGRVSLLAGGPPCQGFSSAGRRDASDKRNDLFIHQLRLARLIRPALVLIENVKGISIPLRGHSSAATRNSHDTIYSDKIRRALDRAGYHAEQGMVRSCDWGVPQFRPRYITVAVRKDLTGSHGPPSFFTIMESIREEFLKGKTLSATRSVTVSDAISDLLVSENTLISCDDAASPAGFTQIRYCKPRTTYQRLLHGELNGHSPNSLRLPNHLPATRRRFRAILRTCRKGVQLSPQDRERLNIRKCIVVPLAPDRPSHTITTIPDDLLHYCEPRVHTVREHARLQSFPDWFAFYGKFTTGGHRRKIECPRYTQVGNAVPPLLAEAIGVALRELLRNLNT